MIIISIAHATHCFPVIILSFQFIGNAVSMVFTLIDPVNPHQEFSVTLDVQEYTKTWKCESIILLVHI